MQESSSKKFKVKTLDIFEKEASKLIKKYPSLRSEIEELVTSLEINPQQGDYIGFHCYKIRLAIKSKGKGKSGGARVITSIFISDEIVFLLSIYDKSYQEDITEKHLKELLEKIQE